MSRREGIVDADQSEGSTASAGTTETAASDSDEAALDALDETMEGEDFVIERALLNDSEAGRQIQAAFIDAFGRFMRDDVRPLLRDIAQSGDQPQLLVNGLAELMRSVAHKIEFPLDHPRSGFPPQLPTSASG